MKSFVTFSIILVVIFILLSSLMTSFMDKLIRENASIYYADEVFSENYRQMDLNSLEKSGGWIVVLYDDYSVEYLSLDLKREVFEQNSVIDLISNGLIVDDIEYYGTIKRFTDIDGIKKIGIVALPSEIIDVKYTINNIFEGRNEFVIVNVLVLITFISMFLILVWAMSRRIKTKFSDPINEISDGLESVIGGDYQIVLSQDTIYEINNIKNAFNAMTNKLDEMQNKVKSEEQNILRLFSDLSHDLRTPLTIIQGYSQRLITSNESIQKNSKYLRAIYKNTTNISELLDVMLDYTVMNRNSFIISLVENDICEVFRDVIANKFLEFENHDMSVEIRIPEAPINVDIDTKSLRRAFDNLLNNIISHNENGTNVFVSLEKFNDSVVIVIADSGVNIPEGIIDNIFNPFVRGDGSRESGSHSGLGLSIAKKAIEINGGTIRIDQPFECYTKAFIIKLPIKLIG